MAICTLVMILSLGVFLAIDNEVAHSVPSSVIEQAPPTAIISVSPQATADLSKTAGTTVTFNLTLASSPSISLFGVWLQYNTSVLSPVNPPSNTVDYTGNILGPTAKAQSECVGSSVIAGSSCALTAPDVISLVLYTLGNQTSSTPGGLLYRVTFQVLESGFARLHILQYVLTNGVKDESYNALSTNDGYFTNRYCSGTTFCQPLKVSFTFSPPLPPIGGTVFFNASSSVETNAGGNIVSYQWSWGEQSPCRGVGTQTTINPIITHVFCTPQNFSVSLLVSDSYGVTWGVTRTVTVVYVFIQLFYSGPIQVDQKFGLIPGTTVHITAGVTNNSTQTVPANLTITVNTVPRIIWTRSFNLSANGLGANTGTIGPLAWNTSADLPVQAYRIDLSITSSVHQNNTLYTSESTFVQFVVPQTTGLLSLSLLQSSGVGILAIIALVAGISRFRRKPSWETEELSPG
jgi:hypothetical protein